MYLISEAISQHHLLLLFVVGRKALPVHLQVVVRSIDSYLEQCDEISGCCCLVDQYLLQGKRATLGGADVAAELDLLPVGLALLILFEVVLVKDGAAPDDEFAVVYFVIGVNSKMVGTDDDVVQRGGVGSKGLHRGEVFIS